MPKFKITPILLFMALICFIFPFVHVKCTMDNPMQGLTGAPQDSTAKKTDTLIMTYNGYHLLLGIPPENQMLKNGPAKGAPEEKTPAKTVNNAMPGMDEVMHTVAQEPIEPVAVDSLGQGTAPAVTDTASSKDKSGKPAAKAEEDEKAMPNIYALVAFLLMLAAIPLSLMKRHVMSVVVAGLCFIAAVLLYLMKQMFPAYLLKYLQLDPQAMQYISLEFTPVYWAALVLPLLAMIESVLHFARPTVPEALPFEEPQFAPDGEFHLEAREPEVPAELADILEPSDLVDDIREAHELERVADLENVKDLEDIHMVIPEDKEEDKPE